MKAKRSLRFVSAALHWKDSKGRIYRVSPFHRGIGSEFVHHLPKLLKKTKCRDVVLYVRASSQTQKDRGNLANAVAKARKDLEALGCRVLKVFTEVAHSRIVGILGTDRLEFRKAIAVARAHDAILVAPSRDRLLRHERFTKTNGTEWPAIYEYREFARLTTGVLVATILHPNLRARRWQILNGQKAKGNRNGRPRLASHSAGWRKRRKECYLCCAEAWREEGWSLRKIADWFRNSPAGFPVPSHTAIWNWLNAEFP